MKIKFSNVADGKATILLYKHFGYDKNKGEGINGSLIAEHIQALNEYSINNPDNAITGIEVKINSPGGDVHNGFSVCEALLSSKIPVTTNVVGMAYSIAGVVAMCGHKKKMSDYATFMMHDASGNKGGEVLELISSSLAKIFENNTNLTLDKCKELMKRETWYNAEECLKNGLIDEIVNTSIKKPIMNGEVELHAFYNKLIEDKPKKPKTMLKVTNLFKLDNEASEDAIFNAANAVVEAKDNALEEVETLKAENETLKAENEAKEAELKAFKEKSEAEEKAAKELVLENAIKEGKIEAEKKDSWLAKDIDSVELKNMFDAIKTVPAHTPVFNNNAGGKGGEDRASWTYSDWEKKDSEGLAQLQNSNPAEFQRLVSTIDISLKSKR